MLYMTSACAQKELEILQKWYMTSACAQKELEILQK